MRLPPLVIVTLFTVVTARLQAPAAADDVLKIVPADVLGAVVLPHPNASQQKLNALAADLQLPVPDLVQLAILQSGLVGGIDPDGPMAVVIDRADAKDDPQASLVYCLTATNYDALLQRVGADTSGGPIATATVNGRTLLLSSKDGFLLISVPRFRTTLEKVLEASDSLVQATEGLTARRQAADVSLIMSQHGIRWMQQQILKGLNMVRNEVARQQPDNGSALAAFSIYESVVKDLPEQFRAGLVGLAIDEDGLRLTKSGLLSAPGTGSSEGPGRDALVQQLTGIGEQSFVMALASHLPDDVSKAFVDFSVEASTLYFQSMKVSEAYLREMSDFSRRLMTSLDGMTMVFGTPQSGESLYARTSFTMQVADPQAFLEDYLASVEKLEVAAEGGDAPPVRYSVSRTTEEGQEIVTLETDLQGFFKSQPFPQQEQMMKMLFGEDGKLNVYLAATEDRVIGQYVSKERLLALIRSDQSHEVPAHLRATTRLLPEDAVMVGFWSVEGTVQMTRGVLAIFAEGAPDLPEMKTSPPAGMAVSLRKDRIDFDAVLPKTTILNIADFARQVRQNPPRR